MRVRPWEGPAGTTAMQQLASRLWPRGPHPGGVGWDAAVEQLPDETALAVIGRRVAGRAGLSGGDLVVQADPASAERWRPAALPGGIGRSGARRLSRSEPRPYLPALNSLSDLVLGHPRDSCQ